MNQHPIGVIALQRQYRDTELATKLAALGRAHNRHSTGGCRPYGARTCARPVLAIAGGA